jgi:hypothetical protein
MRKTLVSISALTLSLAMPALAAGSGDPCQQIVQACTGAGFVKGDWRQGYGLYRDCVDPIMHGQTSVPGGKKPLPSVSPALVTACKAKNPKFGEGKVGS